MSEREAVRRRIVGAATRLLESEGREAVTTRAVSAAAGVQPPTIYRLFTDMRGLLEAVAESGFNEYLARKREQRLTDDPVADLHAGWDLHVQFGLDYPAHYLLMYGQTGQGHAVPAVNEGLARLRMLVERIAAAGRLTVGVDTAIAMVHAACVGTTLGLLASAPAERDLDRSRRLRESTIGAVTGRPVAATDDLAQRAVGLKAALDQAGGMLTPGEHAILGELLDRLAGHRAPRADRRA
ncbi:TetR/AcrR family transcriptional regulator [Glycomyces albidus]|jgi:AcrR family transcriptional regulator|uniref:TetR family transcriptional regulator n=1 Tax=Glycomyces albidus TaxID=2656774 RepID=A0A6L5G4X4_9ACTN|nr:TetR/AcrR family transcriptional regulator [Glycomyces albidus]MQM24677.1 TetR family transcriptional regulator [Glycomyces albidus]